MGGSQRASDAVAASIDVMMEEITANASSRSPEDAVARFNGALSRGRAPGLWRRPTTPRAKTFRSRQWVIT